MSETNTEVVADAVEAVVEELDEVLVVVRNNPYLLAGVGVGGALIGALVAYKVSEKMLKTKYEELANAEIAEAREFYARLHKTGDQYETPEKAFKALHPGEELPVEQPRDELFEKAVAAVQQYGPTPGNAGKINYSRIPTKNVETPASDESELVVEAERVKIRNTVFVEPSSAGVWDYDEQMLLRESLEPHKPYIIHRDEFLSNESGYEQVTLGYFDGDGVLSDDRDVEINDIEGLVGEDNMIRFGFGSEDPNMVYIRNADKQMDFEILLHKGSYAVEVAGLDGPRPT